MTQVGLNLFSDGPTKGNYFSTKTAYTWALFACVTISIKQASTDKDLLAAILFHINVKFL
jgi:hypothetical protein